MCAFLQISYHWFFSAENERNIVVKFHIVMYKIVFEEVPGELYCMDINVSYAAKSLLTTYKRHEI